MGEISIENFISHFSKGHSYPKPNRLLDFFYPKGPGVIKINSDFPGLKCKVKIMGLKCQIVVS